MVKKILFVDNDTDFLETRVERLESGGYQVYPAASIEQAEQILAHNWVHVAIIDVRMRDENDDKDTSGLSLAKKKAYQSVPKIILTAYPSYENVREALAPPVDGMPPAVHFLSKQEGPQALIDAIEQVINKHVRINWNLKIAWSDLKSFSFPHLVDLVEPQLTRTLLPDRVDEIEDLFRKLFYDYEQVTFSHLLWRKGNRVAIEVRTYTKSKEAQLVVTCGQAAAVLAELERYQTVAPEMHAIGNPVVGQAIETLHYAAITWNLSAHDTPNTRTMANLIREATERKVTAALENLFQTTLAPWHQQTDFEEGHKNLTQRYWECLGIPDVAQALSKRDLILEALGKNAISRRLLELTVSQDQLAFRFPNGKAITCLNPFVFIERNEIVPVIHPIYCASLGQLDVSTILLENNGQSWVTDFERAERALPVWQDFVSLEISIRFNLIEMDNLLTLYEFEKQLLAANHLGEALSGADIEPEYRQAFGAIQTIRRLAAQAAGDNLAPYYLGLLINMVKDLASYDSTIYQSRQEVIAWVYRLLMASMICEKLADGEETTSDEPPEAESLGIQVDETAREIRVRGRKVNLTPTEFGLILYLYHNANQLCKRQDIVRDVFGYSNASRDAERSLLNTNIERLRSKIEADLSRPKYILTIRGQGYKLVTDPASL